MGVGLVAKLAGHKSAIVRLSHDAHAMRDSGETLRSWVRLMEAAYDESEERAKTRCR